MKELKIECLTIKRVDVVEYLRPHAEVLKAQGYDYKEFAKNLHGFVEPENPLTININQNLEVDGVIYNRFVSHEAQHIRDNLSGLIPFDTVVAKEGEAPIKPMTLLRAETRAMVAEYKHMTLEEIANYKQSQFESRELYGFQTIWRDDYFSTFAEAEESVLGMPLLEWEEKRGLSAK